MKPYFSKWGEERVDCSRLSGILLGRKIQKGEIFILSEIFPQGSTDRIVVSVCRLKLKKGLVYTIGKIYEKLQDSNSDHNDKSSG